MPKAKKNSKTIKEDKVPKTGESDDKGEDKSQNPVTAIPEKESADTDHKEKPITDLVKDDIRVLYNEKCSKLTNRGVGQLQYELGLNDSSQESFIRIVACGSTGAFSKTWIKIEDIKKMVGDVEEEGFRATILRELYKGRSTNNHGFLGAVLKHLEVFSTEPDQPTVLYLESWEPLKEKIESLKKSKT